MLIVQIVLACVFSIPELRYGIGYRNECLMEPMVSTFLTVHDATKFAWVFLNILAVFDARVIYGKMNRSVLARQLMFLNLIFQGLFAVWFPAWFIAGNVWVFRNRNRHQSADPTNSSTYYHEELYRAAFVLIIMTYVIFAITVIFTIKRRFTVGKIKYVINNNPNNDHEGTDRI